MADALGCVSVSIEAMAYRSTLEPGWLIQQLEFQASPGRFVSFLGRTGAGKTTLFRIIAGFERSYTGCVTLDSAVVCHPSRRIQIVFQDYRLVPWLTVYQNMAFATAAADNAGSKRRIEEWLQAVGLENRRDAWPKTLSGGETGRVAFARAFIDEPTLLLLDEPFHGLDLTTKFELQDHLNNFLSTQPTTVLMISHSIEDAVFMSDEVHVLSKAPMRIQKTFDVAAPKPRRRGDPDLSKIAAEITRFVIGHARD